MESFCEYGNEASVPITDREESEFGFQEGLLLGSTCLVRCTFVFWQKQKITFL